MKILGRPPAALLRAFMQSPALLAASVRAFGLVENPVGFLWNYLTKTSPASRCVRFRDGLTIHLPGEAEDIVTIFLVFMRRDYGFVPAGTDVVDIGANIGVFSLYAARQGAARVIACEPGLATSELLRRNIEANGLQDVITLVKEAVTNDAGGIVKFPVAANANTSIPTGDFDGETEEVRTTTLNEIVDRFELRNISVLKMDCEGSEYPILLETDDLNLQPVQAVRMEYHNGQVDQLSKKLSAAGLQMTEHTIVNPHHGQLCFERRAA
ncbi:MAG: FkbM family methyltransferase [Planctomycetaceae bacterium]|nr:FkbM family methyltransferase [Planctomycetaceae bacterium]